jgi:GNAT superfamily N-acetyltransferase
MINIRPARPADVPLMLAFVRELAEYEREPHSVRMTEKQLLEDGFGTDPHYECLIAEWDGAPAGWALFFPIYSTWEGRGLHVEDLFIRPAFRGQGIGKALLHRVATLAVERGCKRLQWEVLNWNTPAIEFYWGLGAVMLDEWRPMRMSGPALKVFAGES